VFYEIIKFLGRPLAYLLFWPVFQGREGIPGQGPGIFVGNHIGTGETFLLPAFVKPQLTFPVKKELFKTDTLLHRLGGWFLKTFHQVPMDRAGGRSAVDGLGAMLDVLEKGGFVAIFPEGHRSPDGRLYKGRTGVARLALPADATIIPVGAFRTRFTRRKWLPFPWLFRPELRFGTPFKLPEAMRQAFLAAPNHDASSAILREATDEVMRHVQAITGQEMVDEYSLRPGKSRPLPTAPSTPKLDS
jgi:1-acyl-sn-glycerol-3-phosphate acyltransferase